MKQTHNLFIKLLLTIFFCHSVSNSLAQFTINKELEPLLKGKTKMNEIMPVVNRFYHAEKDQDKFKKEEDETDKDSEYERWMRWAWYQSRHLDSNGDFVNSNERNYAVFAQRLQQNTNLVSSSTASSGNWSFYGPDIVNSGIARVDRIAFHPNNVNIMYAGTPAGGLWVTYDGGISWSALNGYVPELGVSGIIVDADNPNNLYVLSGDGDSYANGGFIYLRNSIGLMRSTDAGATWTKLSNILPGNQNYYGYKLIQHPQQHNVFFACTSGGLYRSTDYGVTWDNVAYGSIYDLETGPDGYVYASGNNWVYISSNYGSSFSLVPNTAFSQPPNGFTQRTSLAVTSNSPNTLYVNFGGAYSNGQEHLLYRSDNNGTSYTLISNNCPVTSGYANTMAVNPADVNNVIIGNVDLRTSTNGGTSFNNGSPGVHADFHDLAYNPLNNVLYAGCDGGVYRSVNNGVSWTPIHNGIRATQYYHMAGFEGDDGLAMGGAQDNGMHSRASSTTYTLAGGGDGYDAVYYNGNSNNALYSINAGVYLYFRNTNSSFLRLNPTNNINDQSVFYPSLAIHPSTNNIQYAGYTTGVYRSVDGGVNWTNTGASGSAGFGFSGGLAVSANQPNRIYAANGSTLSISNNQGGTWTTISGNPGWTTFAAISDVTTRPNNADEVWVTFGGYGGAKVFYSSNAGASWSDFTGSLPDVPAYSIKYSSQGDAYIGTDAGVFFMDFSMSDWVPFYNGLPMVPVTELVINETNNTVKAATFGRGMWISNLYSDCLPSLVLSGAPQGAYTWQASSTIESTELITGSAGNDIRYRSPKITLKPGFKAQEGSFMLAKVGPCGQGVFNPAVKATPKKKQ